MNGVALSLVIVWFMGEGFRVADRTPYLHSAKYSDMAAMKAEDAASLLFPAWTLQFQIALKAADESP